jgi:hypothetical protein
LVAGWYPVRCVNPSELVLRREGIRVLLEEWFTFDGNVLVDVELDDAAIAWAAQESALGVGARYLSEV